MGALILVAAVTSAGLTALLLPHLRTWFLVPPGARSSHRAPTPQGGGLAVVIATFACAWGVTCVTGGETAQLLALTAATALLALTGAIDDLRNLPPWPRLLVQRIALPIAIAALPAELRIEPALPWYLERALIFLVGLWFLNLVNFMDGIDWMMVAEVVPIAGAMVLLEYLGILAPLPTLLAAALLGAMLGFAPYNKPVARLFLGDSGSLPVGLVLGWLLMQLAIHGHLAAALLLALYFIADATLTLLWRMQRREPFWLPHRSHFYQQAIARGYSVPAVVGRVFGTNVVLATLAFHIP